MALIECIFGRLNQSSAVSVKSCAAVQVTAGFVRYQPGFDRAMLSFNPGLMPDLPDDAWSAPEWTS